MRLLALAVVLFFAQPALSAQIQFFPPQGPCNADNPILAWNGNGSTYCTRFPTAAIPDCGDGEFLTKKNGNLACVKVSTGAVSSSTPAAPTAPTTTTSSGNTTTPTPAYNSNGTPTGAAPSVAASNGKTQTTPVTIPNPVQRTGNNACPDITIPVCASDSVLVNYGLDFNGCQTSPQCKYMGSTAAAQAAYASYANGGLSNNSVASSNGYGYYDPYASYYSGSSYYTTPTYVDEVYVEPEPVYYEEQPSYASEPYYEE
ncbi:MAG: hypothetical protein SFW65_08140 [Alphaproteobacteria bacterium]|nr:hypothetical protein [Alphaproteobacteria bacterium]